MWRTASSQFLLDQPGQSRLLRFLSLLLMVCVFRTVSTSSTRSFWSIPRTKRFDEILESTGSALPFTSDETHEE